MPAESTPSQDPQQQSKAESPDDIGARSEYARGSDDKKKNVPQLASLESDVDAEYYEGIAGEIDIGEEEETQQHPTSPIENPPQKEAAGNQRKDLVIPNRPLILLSDRSALLEKLAELTKANDEASQRLTEIQAYYASVADRVRTVSISSYPYRVYRNRFISAFKRDKLGCATEADLQILDQGSEVPSVGDAFADSLLYDGTDARRDPNFLQKLYGLHPHVVQNLHHRYTIYVLNTHASVLSSKYKIGSDKFYELFEWFLKAFEECGEGYDTSYLVGIPTDVTRAYHEFLRCLDMEVITVEATN